MEAAEKCFRAIGEFLAPCGASIYCFDFVLQGIAQEYDLMSGRNILSHQAQLENRPTETGFYDLLERLKGDVETFFLSPQGHHHWCRGLPYEKFPFRKVVSLQTIAFRTNPETPRLDKCVSLTVLGRILISASHRPKGWILPSL